jgi:hypothetical protein
MVCCSSSWALPARLASKANDIAAEHRMQAIKGETIIQEADTVNCTKVLTPVGS